MWLVKRPLSSLVLGIIILTQRCVEIALAQSFQKVDLGCAPAQSGPNCAKQWSFSGGPGNVGQRASAVTKIFCSPSCQDASNPKVCSLILTLHGAGQDAASMVRAIPYSHSYCRN